ncbi:hypothetical protein Vadar_001058 [Vaccinium darrowii]|uniref:Uncharacterized protein n=1 Tax=Vaccinium darrowii TaxID=229202 RepID=A0ACB7XEP0_9ERIC|nr:hypothetical protein Vadar_001058 [Vaccinium darrowii]
MTSPANKISSTSSALTPSNTTVASSPFPSLTNASHFLSLKLTNTNYYIGKPKFFLISVGRGLLGLWMVLIHAHLLLNSRMMISLCFSYLHSGTPYTTSNIKQGDLIATQFLYKAKALSVELSASGLPLSLQDFNLYVFKGPSSDFNDLVTTLATRPLPLPYSELHSLILSHEFMNMNCFTSLLLFENTIPPPQAHVAHRQSSSSNHGRDHNGNGRGRNHGRGCSNNSNGVRDSNGGSSSGPFYSCGDSRYFSHESRSYHSTDSRQRCQICNGTNHIALSCNQHYNHTMPPSAHLASYKSAPAPYADWFLNTGATHHALAAFNHHEDYHGTDQLQVGNDNGVFFEFHPSHFLVKDRVTKKTLFQGGIESGLYKLSTSALFIPSAHLSEKVDFVCWHRHLSHPHHRVFCQVLVQNKLLCLSNKQ